MHELRALFEALKIFKSKFYFQSKCESEKFSEKKNTTSNFDIAQKERKKRKKIKLVNGSTGGYFDPLRIGANPATFVRIRRNVKSFGNFIVFNSNEKAG